MTYEPPVYPSSIPSQAGVTPDLPDRVDDVDWLYAARYNELKKELCAVLAELGTLPKSFAADVKTRLNTINPALNSLAGNLVQFPASQVPSSNVNALDDYEEGNFVVTLTCSGSGSISLFTTYNTLSYTKIGRAVIISGWIRVESVSAPVGHLALNGLPFQCMAGTKGSARTAMSILLDTAASAALTAVMGHVIASSNLIYIYRFENGVCSALASMIQANTDINVGGVYFTD